MLTCISTSALVIFAKVRLQFSRSLLTVASLITKFLLHRATSVADTVGVVVVWTPYKFMLGVRHPAILV